MNPDSIPGAPTKPGRKPLTPGAHRVATSVSLTPAQHGQFMRLGGSAWVRQQLDACRRCPGCGMDTRLAQCRCADAQP